MPWTTLFELTELTEDKGRYVEVDGFCLAVYLHAGQVYAMDNACPHAGANLAGGWVNEGCVVCPKHGWPFRLEDGQLRGSPGVNVDVYPVRIDQPDGGAAVVQVRLPASLLFDAGKT